MDYQKSFLSLNYFYYIPNVLKFNSFLPKKLLIPSIKIVMSDRIHALSASVSGTEYTSALIYSNSSRHVSDIARLRGFL